MLGELVFRINRQYTAIGGDGFGQEAGAGLAVGADALLAEYGSQVVLSRGPVLGEQLFRLNRQGLAIGGDGVA